MRGRQAGWFDKTAPAAYEDHELRQLTPKLGFHLSYTKQSTSRFLIDNFCASSLSRNSSVRVDDQYPVSNLEPQTSSSNRHIPELESWLSRRKQRTGLISNRHKFAFFNFAPFGNIAPGSLESSLESLTPGNLIANELHSRKMPSRSKQSTYEILIANEFQCNTQRPKPARLATLASFIPPASLCLCLLACILLLPLFAQAQAAPAAQRPEQPEFIQQGNALARQGKLDDALAVFQNELDTHPNSLLANNAAGTVLDLMGRGEEARKRFQTAIESAPTGQIKAVTERAMAMSYAFEGDCAKTGEYEQKVFDYFVSTKDFFQQGEIADEAARVCIDTGDLDAAEKWYRTGHDAGLKEPNISEARKDLWEFRWEHAMARLAARRGNFAEADKHVAAAKAVLDKGTNPPQQVFFPYLVGYVAFYRGDYKTALAQFQLANQNDPFIQCMIAQTYEKLGDKDKAQEMYSKAASTTAHNPPGAYARRMTRKMQLPAASGGE